MADRIDNFSVLFICVSECIKAAGLPHRSKPLSRPLYRVQISFKAAIQLYNREEALINLIRRAGEIRTESSCSKALAKII